mgnify:CR=1 FL=1
MDIPPDAETVEIDLDTAVDVQVLELVARVTDRPVLELPALYDVVDSEALDVIVRDGIGITAMFEYADCMVRIDGTQIAVELLPG